MSFRRVLVAHMERDLPIAGYPVMFKFFAKMAMTFASIVIIIGGIGFSVSLASQANDPDSLWYKIKIAGEQIQLSFVEHNPMESAVLSAKFAQNRLNELKAIEEESLEPAARENVLKLYYQNLQYLQTSLQNITGEPTRQALADLLTLEEQINILDQTIEALESHANVPTTTVFQAQSISRFTKNIIQTVSLQYSVALNVTIEDQYGINRITALHGRVTNRFTELNDTWRPRFQEKVQRIVLDETLSPEKSETYSFTKEEENIVNTLNKAKTGLGEIDAMLQNESLTTIQIMDVAKTLLAIDHELATIEVLLK